MHLKLFAKHTHYFLRRVCFECIDHFRQNKTTWVLQRSSTNKVPHDTNDIAAKKTNREIFQRETRKTNKNEFGIKDKKKITLIEQLKYSFQEIVQA